ncbi:MAG: ATP-binding cassette domain-containing protein [SAR324 cluster bacterium]|nr:ATP-binding cassette domain-containing protein [SAR324 cluster bacterium]
MNKPDWIIEVRDLTTGYSPEVPLLKNGNLGLGAKQAHAIVGANGTGKSTLMKTMLAFVEPLGGDVLLFNESLHGKSRSKVNHLRKNIAVVWQKHNLVPRMSVLSNVIHGAFSRTNNPRVWFQGTAPEAMRKEAMDCLDRVGMGHHASRAAGRLSGGESQRVAIARALMQRPKAILADEPVASLDPKVGKEVMDLFYDLVESEGISLLYTSHNLEHAIEYSHCITALKKSGGTFEVASDQTSVKELHEIYNE